MTDEGRKAARAEEMRLAREELRAAEHLVTLGMPRIALTRAYFGAFHAARAMLFAHGFEPKSHQGALHLFNLHFVKTARFPPPVSRLLARLQKFREEADYGESFVIDEAGAREELTAAAEFVSSVDAALRS